MLPPSRWRNFAVTAGPTILRSTADAADKASRAANQVCVLLHETAADVRADSSETKQFSAILYRVSDLYDPDNQIPPEEIYRSV